MKIYLFYIFLSYSTIILGETILKLEGKHVIVKNFNHSNDLEEWFQSPKTKMDILFLNPTFSKVELKSPYELSSDLPTIQFPGLKIIQSIDFDVFMNQTTLMLSARQGSVKQKYLGSNLMVNLFSRLSSMNVHSEIIISIDKYGQNTLSNEEIVQVTMKFPFNLKKFSSAIERSGSKSIQTNLQTYMESYMKSIFELYKSSKSDHSSNKVSTLYFVKKKILQSNQKLRNYFKLRILNSNIV
jgi:hypothetical protein